MRATVRPSIQSTSTSIEGMMNSDDANYSSAHLPGCRYYGRPLLPGAQVSPHGFAERMSVELWPPTSSRTEPFHRLKVFSLCRAIFPEDVNNQNLLPSQLSQSTQPAMSAKEPYICEAEDKSSGRAATFIFLHGYGDDAEGLPLGTSLS